MSIIGWIAFGLACGFLVSRLVRVRGEDVLLDVALGAAGAVMGGWTFVRLCAVVLHGINVPSLGVAAGGALLAPLAYHAVFGRRAAD